MNASTATRERSDALMRVGAKLQRWREDLVRELKERVRAYGQDHSWSVEEQMMGERMCDYLFTPVVLDPKPPLAYGFVSTRVYQEFYRLAPKVRRMLPMGYTVGQQLLLRQSRLPKRS